jgi:DNA-directed RNA polymerase subunit RPC12/RpoP
MRCNELLRVFAVNKAMTCPTCNSAEIRARGKRNMFYPLGMIAIIGLPFALLHQLSSPLSYHCNECGLDFAQRTKTARVAHLFLILLAIVFGLLIAVGAIAVLIENAS